MSDRYVGYFHEVGTDTDGEWTRASDITDNRQDELLTSGSDAYLTLDVPDFKARPNQIVFVTMSAMAPDAVDSTPRGQVFRRRPGGSLTESRSTTFEINLDGDTHIYAVCPSFRRPWEGTTDEVRVDLADGVPGLKLDLIHTEVRK